MRDARQFTIQENRKEFFVKGKTEYPEYNNTLPITSYKSAAYNDGHNFSEGAADYPNNKCPWKKGTRAYKFYMLGFNSKKNKA